MPFAGQVLVNVAFANADVFDSEMATVLRDLLVGPRCGYCIE